MSINSQRNSCEINKDINEVKKTLESIFSVPDNFDFIIRDFEIRFDNGSVHALLTFYDGLVNQTLINRDIMRSLTNS